MRTEFQTSLIVSVALSLYLVFSTPVRAVVEAAGGPNAASGCARHEKDFVTAYPNRPAFVHAFELWSEPTTRTFVRQQRPRLALVVAAQELLLRFQRAL